MVKRIELEASVSAQIPILFFLTVLFKNGGKNMELQNTKFNSFSNLITVIVVAAGVVGHALIYGLFGIDIQDVPVVTMIVLWVAISGIAYEVLRDFEK